MDVIEEILTPVKIPRFVKIRQIFDKNKITKKELPLRINNEIRKEGMLDRVKANQKVGITAGSRGIANIALIIREIVRNIREVGAQPYIISCMGSHGGARAKGQRQILNKLGITEEYIKAPILSSMDVVKIGKTVSHVDIYVDKNAVKMDALIVVNRIKPHTAFRAEVESGIQKIIAVGLGKQKGAEACHALGFGKMHRNITEITDVVLNKLNIAFAIGIIENAYDETFECIALRTKEIKDTEPVLLEIAKNHRPQIMFKDLDVLIVDEMGKNISGGGMDTNIIGRYATPYISGGPNISKIAVLDLTKESKGNATGVGHADFITQRLKNKIKLEETYPNALTSTVTGPVKIPMILSNDLLAIKAGIMTCNRDYKKGIRIVRIRNTLKIEEIWISEALIDLAKANKYIEIISNLQDMYFDNEGNLFNLKNHLL